MDRAAISASEALRAAHAVGLRLALDGDDLVLEAPSTPPADVIDLLARHKAGIVRLLRAPVLTADRPLIMADGRCMYRIQSTGIEPATDAARTAMMAARKMGAVLVADYITLIAVFPRPAPPLTLAALQRHSAGVLGILHGESNARLADAGL